MSQVLKKKFNGKTYKIKYSLTDSEGLSFVAECIDSIFSNNDTLPYFIAKPLVIKQALVLNYIEDIKEEDVESLLSVFDNGIAITDIILDNIYYVQYEELMQSINDGIDFQVKKIFYNDSVDNKIDMILDSILDFSNNFPIWADKIQELLETKDGDKLLELLSPIIVKLGLGDKK